MLKKMLVIVALLTLLTSVTIFAQTSNDAAVIRYVHAVSSAPAVDVYVNGTLSYANLSFGEASPYLAVAAGSHAISVVNTSSTTELWSQSVDVLANSAQILVANVGSGSPSFTAFEDDLSSLALGRTRLTAIHAIEETAAVDVVLADGRPVMPNLEFGTPYGTLDIPAQTYSLVVLPAGGSLGSAIIAETSFNLDSGTSYVAVALGSAEAPELLLLSAPTVASGDAGYVRVVFGAVEGDPVDVFFNETLVASQLAYSTASEYIAIPAGDYAVRVSTSGSADALATADVSVSAGGRTTVVAHGVQGEISISDFSSASLTSADEAAVTLSNTVTNTEASAALSDEFSLANAVEAGDSASAQVVPSAQDIDITFTFSELDTTESFGVSSILGGIYYDAVIIPGEASPVALLLPPVSIPLTSGVPAVVVVAPVETVVAEESPVAPTADPNIVPAATATPQAQIVVPQGTLAPPSGAVQLDPGANIHLRQYPGSDAFSLGLAPSGTVFVVNGREGAPAQITIFTATPTPEGFVDEEEEYVDPVIFLEEDEDLDPRETWINVTYSTPDGGSITAWVNALYLRITDARGNLMKLRDLPPVPQNQAGQVNGQAAGVAPTANPLRNVNVATVVGLVEDARLHLRRNPNIASESLALLPNGASFIVTGRTEEGDWIEAQYEGQVGWVSAAYVRVTFNDRAIDTVTIPVQSTPIPDDADESEESDE